MKKEDLKEMMNKVNGAIDNMVEKFNESGAKEKMINTTKSVGKFVADSCESVFDSTVNFVKEKANKEKVNNDNNTEEEMQYSEEALRYMIINDKNKEVRRLALQILENQIRNNK